MYQRLNDQAYLVTNDETPYIAFTAFDGIDGIKAGFSTRLGGVSKGHLKSLNLGYDLGDSDENIICNYKRIASSIGFDIENVVLSVQVHKNDVIDVTEADRGKGLLRTTDFSSADGLITDKNDVVLTVRGADCVPMFFVDKKKRVIATAHGGWAGTVTDIAGNAVEKMVNKYGSSPDDIVAVIGPSICPDCYEISEDVATRFIEHFGDDSFKEFDVDGYINKSILTPGTDNHYYANLWLANRANMINKGLKPENIHNTCLCTKCNMELFYSHRGMNGKRGVMSGFLLKDFK